MSEHTTDTDAPLNLTHNGRRLIARHGIDLTDKPTAATRLLAVANEHENPNGRTARLARHMARDIINQLIAEDDDSRTRPS